MTLTTIGYGDSSPTTEAMQLSTVFYSLPGIGFFVAFTARLVQVSFQSRQADDEAATAAAIDDGHRGTARNPAHCDEVLPVFSSTSSRSLSAAEGVGW